MPIEWLDDTPVPAISAKTRLDLARQAVQRFPDSAPVHYALAELHFRNEDFADCAAAGERAMDLAPPAPAFVGKYANALIALDRAGEALGAIARVVPLSPGLRAVRGEALHRLGRSAEARLDFEAALSADPSNVAAASGMVGLLAAAGAWAELLALAERVEACGALLMPLAHARLRALIGLGRHREARALLDFDGFVRMQTIAPPPGFESLAAFNAALEADLQAPGHTRLTDRPRIRLRGGEQIEDLKAHPSAAMRALFAVLRAQTQAYFDGAHGLAATSLARFAPARASLSPWALLLGPEDFQARHFHLDAVLSGVYYVAAPQAALQPGTRDGALVIPDPPGELEGGESLIRYVQPEPGRLVLFPGYIPHRTRPSHHPGSRISIAFNVVAQRPEAGL